MVIIGEDDDLVPFSSHGHRCSHNNAPVSAIHLNVHTNKNCGESPGGLRTAIKNQYSIINTTRNLQPYFKNLWCNHRYWCNTCTRYDFYLVPGRQLYGVDHKYRGVKRTGRRLQYRQGLTSYRSSLLPIREKTVVWQHVHCHFFLGLTKPSCRFQIVTQSN